MKFASADARPDSRSGAVAVPDSTSGAVAVPDSRSGAVAAPEISSRIPGSEGRTRDAVARSILQSGPLTAAALAERLHLSPAAIRRHLDALVSNGVLSEVEPRSATRRGRGRPARAYALTDLGRARFTHAYDDLASTALRYLRETSGESAVADFADRSARKLAERLRAKLSAAEQSEDGRGADPSERLAVVISALNDEGYAADVTPAGHGLQICQHHCPVAHVAAEFPELCEAETRALADVLGTNVQRLATIAHGDGVCTTHVPRLVPLTIGQSSITTPSPNPGEDSSTAHISLVGRK